MFAKANPGRDAFTFSLGGVAAINTYVPATVIADDRINKAIDARLRRRRTGRPAEAPALLKIEDFLARYYAAGCCKPA